MKVTRERKPSKTEIATAQAPAVSVAASGWGPFLARSSAILLLFVLRRPDSLLHPQFWAEDGPIYFSQAMISGPASIFFPYAGCLWILPRIVAVAVTLLPPLWAPFTFNLTALAIDAACCALFSLPAYRHLVRSDWLRIACCLLFAALPAGSEMIGTLTNMPWYLALAVILVLALPSASLAALRIRHVVWIAAGVALAAASSPVLLTAAPLALWQAYRTARRDSKMFAIAASLLAGLLVQALVNVAFLHKTLQGSASFFPNFPLTFLFLGFLRCILGEGLTKLLAQHYLTVGVAAGSLLIAAALVLLLRRLNAALVLCASVIAIGPLAMAIAGRHAVWATGARILDWGGYRYFLLPGCAFIFLAAAFLDTYPRFHFPAVALLLLFALGAAGNFSVAPYPDMDWPGQIHLIRRWLDTGCAVSIPVPPDPNWKVELPNVARPEDGLCRSAWLRAKRVDAAHIGPVIPITDWDASPAWTHNGFHPSVGALSGETLFGSYSGSDANRGTLTSAPFDTNRQGCIVLPIAHGPSLGGQSVKLLDADRDEDLGRIRLDEKNGNWQYWAIYFSREVPELRIVADDQGDQYGQWVAIGEPHACRAT